MSNAEQVRQAMQQMPGTNRTFTKDNFDLKSNSTGSRSEIATSKAIRPLVIRENKTWDAHIPAYQSYTTDGTGGDAETISLDHNVIDADGVAENVVAYEGGDDATSKLTVDYANNSVDIANTDADATVDLWYITDEQARLEIRKTAPSNYYADLDERDAGMLNLRDQSRDPLTFEFNDEFAGAIPTDWSLTIHIDAPFPVKWSGTGDAEPRNALITIPVHRKKRELPALEPVVKDRLDRV